MATSKEITQMLQDWNNGDQEALARLMPIVYDELRKLADRYLRHERSDHTLQPTALVNEVYLRLIDQEIACNSRAYFFGVAAQLMRRILVEHARKRNAAKRGHGEQMLSLDEKIAFSGKQDIDLIKLDDALKELAGINEEQSKIVEMRFFAGLTNEEIAEVMGVSVPTVRRKWEMAKTWLYHQLYMR